MSRKRVPLFGLVLAAATLAALSSPAGADGPRSVGGVDAQSGSHGYGSANESTPDLKAQYPGLDAYRTTVSAYQLIHGGPDIFTVSENTATSDN